MISFQVSDSEDGKYRMVFFRLADGADPAVVGKKIDEVKEAFNGPFTVVFRGAGPCWLYAMLAHASHATNAVACFQPRLGYVVVTSHDGKTKVGTTLQTEEIGLEVEGDQIIGGKEFKLHHQLVVAVGGPPHSGKSVFLNELYHQIREEMSSDVFLQRACPDGEGMWMYGADPELAQKVRQKGKFGPEFTSAVKGAIANLKKGFKIVLLDLGGMRLPPNDVVLTASTHQIVLSSNEEETKKWVEYGESFGVKTLAVLNSELVKLEEGGLDEAVRSKVNVEEEPIVGTLYNLDRVGLREPYQKAIEEIAREMVRRVS